MKYGLSFLLVVLVVASVHADINATGYLIVARGIVEGISSVKTWSDITSCINNNEGITTGIADAIATFKLNDTTTLTPAAIKLGKALQKFPDTLKQCNNTIQISTNLFSTLAAIASLKDYIQIIRNNLVIYNVDLVKESYQATREYVQGNLRNFGNKVGQGLAQVFLNGSSKVPPKPDINTTSAYILITHGIVEGIGAARQWNEIKACIKESKDSTNDINSTVEYFKKGDPVSVAQALAALGSALQDIPASLQDCASSYDKASNLTKAIAAITDPVAYAYVVGQNLLVNGVDIYDEIYSAVESYNVGALYNFGFNVGQALSKLFFDGIVTGKNTRWVNFLE